MTWGAPAVAGAAVIGGVISSQQQAGAQREANIANERLSLIGINEQRRQFEARTGELSQSRREREDEINQQLQGRFDTQVSERLDPFFQAGTAASTERSALLGLGGNEAQQQAFSRITESPGQTFLRERQERALLRNASALGGLGGGNIRTALQEQAFGRAQTDIDRQIERLGGVVGTGLSAAQGGVGGPGRVQTGADVGVRSGPAAGPEAVQSGSGGGGGGGGILGGIADTISGLF